jgi:hypothetical protein
MTLIAGLGRVLPRRAVDTRRARWVWRSPPYSSANVAKQNPSVAIRGMVTSARMLPPFGFIHAAPDVRPSARSPGARRGGVDRACAKRDLLAEGAGRKGYWIWRVL